MLKIALNFAREAIADLIAPLRCASCDAFLKSRALFCDACAASVELCEGSDSPIAVAYYGGAMASALLRLKYANRPDIAYGLGELLSCRMQECGLGQVDMVVPVPVPTSRLVERGYNQAALIASMLVPAIGNAFAPRALGRHPSQYRQAELNRSERLKNLEGAFYAIAPKELNGRRAILIDDVSTTGATIESCKWVLESAGAKVVAIGVVARVENKT